MFKLSVAQKPTIPVSAGKKKAKKPAVLANLEGWSKIGPNPCPAFIAQNNKAKAATGRKKALKTSNFLMLSTPSQTTYMFSNQKRIKHIAGPVCKPHEEGNTWGNVSSDGIQSRSIW